MDNNLTSPITNTTTPEPAAPQPAQTDIPPAQPTPSTTITPNMPPEDSKKPVLLLIIGALLVLAVVGGIYFYLSIQQTPKQETTLQRPSPSPAEDLEREVEAIDVESTASSEFEELDQDLDQL